MSCSATIPDGCRKTSSDGDSPLVPTGMLCRCPTALAGQQTSLRLDPLLLCCSSNLLLWQGRSRWGRLQLSQPPSISSCSHEAHLSPHVLILLVSQALWQFSLTSRPSFRTQFSAPSFASLTLLLYIVLKKQCPKLEALTASSTISRVLHDGYRSGTVVGTGREGP